MSARYGGLNARNVQPQAVYRNVDELARDLGISRQKAYQGLRVGEIPSIRLGKRFVIPRSAIEQWLKTAGGHIRATA